MSELPLQCCGTVSDQALHDSNQLLQAPIGQEDIHINSFDINVQ